MKRDPRVLIVLLTATVLAAGCASTPERKPDRPDEPRESPKPEESAEAPAPPVTPAPEATQAKARPSAPPDEPAPSSTPSEKPPSRPPAPPASPTPTASPTPATTVAQADMERPPSPKATPPAAKPTPAPAPSPAPTPAPSPAPPAATTGSVSGRIVLVGQGGAPEKNLAGTVVSLSGVTRKDAPSRLSMASQDKAFTPHVIAVPLGASVEFPNNDKIHHNAFSLSDCCKFDLGLYKNGASRAKTFDKEGVCRVYCNIHAQMSGVVVVTKGNANAVTGVDGTFEITGVPPGRHEIVAWHEKAKIEARDVVEVVAGQSAKKELTLDVSGFKVEPHTKKDGRPYGKDDEATY